MEQKNSSSDWKITRFIIISIKKALTFLKKWVRKLNEKSEGKYSPAFIGWSAAAVSLLILAIILFIPPYVGMADDGSFSRTANPAGIYHKEDTRENLYFNYYVREYLSLAPAEGAGKAFTSHELFLYAAKAMDALFTGDSVFDLRYLAFLYCLFYIPAIALLVRQAAASARTFSESVVIGAAGIFVFADVSYISYFSSFYPEPILYISILYCIGAALALREGKNAFLYLAVFTLSGSMLTTAENQCALAGIFLGGLGVRFLFVRKSISWRLACGSSVMLLFISMLVSLYYIPPTYTQASKYHAMTRGVLLQSTDPVKTLKEFGIDSAYSILTDTSSYEEYPEVNPDSKALTEFYQKYSSAEITYYYLRHPGALGAMLDLSVKAAFNMRSSFTGNYEKSAGLPKMARSLFWSMWGNFKINSAPKTIGFIFVILLAVILLFNKRSKEKNYMSLEIMAVIFFIAISQAIITIVNSGDAELSQHLFLFGVSIDILIYFCFCELLHRLKII